MNSINGFSNAIFGTSPLFAIDAKQNRDPETAADDAQGDAFSDVLSGLAQQSGNPAEAGAGATMSGRWTSFGEDQYSDQPPSGDVASEETAAVSPAYVQSDGGRQDAPEPETPGAQAEAQAPTQAESPESVPDAPTNGADAQAGTEPDARMTRSTSPAQIARTAETSTVAASSLRAAARSGSGALAPKHSRAAATATETGARQAAHPSAASSAVQAGRNAGLAVRAHALGTAAQTALAAAAAGATTADEHPGVAAAIAAGKSGLGKQGSAASVPKAVGSDARRKSEKNRSSQAPTPNAASQAALAAAATIIPASTRLPTAGAPQAPSQAQAGQSHGASAASGSGLAAMMSKHGVDANQSASASPEATVEIKAVAPQTHFAPVPQLSATQQIIGAMVPALSQATVSRAPQDAASAAQLHVGTVASTDLQSARGLRKTLDLQLEPQNLGTVSVRLNLSADGLDVQVQASHAATADLLEKDKQSLTAGLKDAGYSVSGVVVGVATPGSAASGFANSGAAGGQGANAGAQSGGGSQAQHGSGNDSSPRQQHRQSAYETSEPARGASRRSGAGIFI